MKPRATTYEVSKYKTSTELSSVLYNEEKGYSLIGNILGKLHVLEIFFPEDACLEILVFGSFDSHLLSSVKCTIWCLLCSRCYPMQ